MYLDSIILTQTHPCLAEPGKIIVVGEPVRRLGEVLPYLATLPDVIGFNPDTSTLTFRRAQGFLTLYADRVYITQVADLEEGIDLLESLKDAINATWRHRESLVAVVESRRAPRPLDVYALLPQTNCQLCGEATCMAFAFGLLQHQHDVMECPAFAEGGDLVERRLALEGMI